VGLYATLLQRIPNFWRNRLIGSLVEVLKALKRSVDSDPWSTGLPADDLGKPL
jgi:hypothetical protein